MEVEKRSFEGGGVLHRLLRRSGITPEYLVERLKEELVATERKVFLSKGRFVYSEELPAWETRQRARMDIFKLLGYYPKEEKEGGDIIVQVLNFSKDRKE